MRHTLTESPGLRIDDRTEVVGVTLKGPPPLGVVELPLRRGLSVLYGRNGAGKTTILHGIASAFNGLATIPTRSVEDEPWSSTPSDAFAHVRILDPDLPLLRDGTLAGSIMTAIDMSVEKLIAGFRTTGDPIGNLSGDEIEDLEYRARGEMTETKKWTGQPAASLELLARSNTYLGREWGHATISNRNADPSAGCRELARMGLLSLRAAGDTHPEWGIMLSGAPSADAPEFTSELGDWQRVAEFQHHWKTRVTEHDRIAIALLSYRASTQNANSAIEMRELEARIARVSYAFPDLSAPALSSAWDHPSSYTVLDPEAEEAFEQFRDLASRVHGEGWWNRIEDFVIDFETVLSAVDSELMWHFDAIGFSQLPIADAVRGGFGTSGRNVPVPIVQISSASHIAMPAPITFEDSNPRSLELETTYRIAPYLDPSKSSRPGTLDWIFTYSGAADTTEEFAAQAASMIAELELNANDLLGRIWPELPELRLRLGSLKEWHQGRAVIWEARDTISSTWIPLEGLSSAQQRWAALAIRLALAGNDFGSNAPPIILLDEPELALHSTSARTVANGLIEATRDFGSATVVASHSPAFLGHPGTVPIHVTRDPKGIGVLTPLSASTAGRVDQLADSLDLTRSELLQLVDVFVLVEGAHDVAVFEGLIGEELGELGARVIPMRGTHALRGFESELLFDFTDASIVIVVDNIDDAETVENAWLAAQQLAADGSRDLAVQKMSEALAPGKGTSTEAGELLQLTRDLLSDPLRRDRVIVTGVRQPDIQMYLPIEAFGDPHGATWADLKSEHQKLVGSSTNFKNWLRLQKSIEVTTASVTAAVQEMDTVPVDIARLLTTVEQARARRAINRRLGESQLE